MQAADRQKWPRMTVREFAAHPAMQGPAELVRGEVRMMTPASGPHGVIVVEVLVALHAFVTERGLGACFADNTGFDLPGLPDTVRSPDVAFVKAEKLPADGLRPGFPTLAPDLAVEVLSPGQTVASMREKLDDYREAGTSLVWIIDPANRTVRVLPASGDEVVLRESDTLTGGELLTGFELPVARIFARVARV